VLRLEPCERLVHVMSVLERYSDLDCSVLLGCAWRDAIAARNSRVRANRNAIDYRVGRRGKGRDSESCLDRRLELITTTTRVTRILVLVLLLASVVDFSLDSARFDLVVMTAALAIFLSGGLRSP
jgi:hypothetical protein